MAPIKRSLSNPHGESSSIKQAKCFSFSTTEYLKNQVKIGDISA